jgi:hypothetical protein
VGEGKGGRGKRDTPVSAADLRPCMHAAVGATAVAFFND